MNTNNIQERKNRHVIHDDLINIIFRLFPLKMERIIVNIFVHVLYKDLTLFIRIIPFSTECIS